MTINDPRYHRVDLLDTEAQNVPTEVSADTSDKVSMIAILTDLQTQLDGHAKTGTHPSDSGVLKRNAELVQENDLLKVTLSGKEKSIAFLQSEKEKILSEKKELADSYLDEIVCLKTANKVARDMLQRFNMPTQTIPMLSKKPKKATADLHKDILGTRNPGLGYMAKRAQPVLYDADTLLHPNHHPVSIWDSEEVLVHQVVSMKKMNEKPGHVRPANDFYAKLNALMFVPQKELSGDQAYWLSANEIASQASKPATPATPFVHKSRPPSQVLASLQKVNAVFPQFEGRSTMKQCVLDNKNLTIEKKNLLIRNDGLIADCLEKDICSIVLTSDIVVPPSSNCLCEDLRSACDREHTKVLELEAEISKQKQLFIESEKRFAFLEQNYVCLQLKFQNYKQCIDTSSASNAIFEINKLRQQLQGKDDTIRNLDAQNTITSIRIQARWPLSRKVRFDKDGVKPTSGASKTVPKRAPRNHSSMPVKKANARRVEAHHRILNKKNRVDSNLLVKHSVSVSDLNNVCGACNKSLVFANHTDCLVMCDGSVNVKTHQTKRFKRQPKKEWKPIKRVWKPINKPVANSKPQWKPTGRHFSLFEKHPLTRIMESTDQPIELPPSASSSPKITMVSRFADHKLSDRQAGSKGISGIFDC
ncbi:hypothetical protein Tco_1301977 [Tanacetum coccineum]